LARNLLIEEKNRMNSNAILDGSHREHPKNSEFAGEPCITDKVKVTCVLRRANAAPEYPGMPLTHQELAANHGATMQDIQVVEQFAASHHFTVESVNPAARLVAFSGPLAEMARAFGVTLELRTINGQVIRTRQGSIHLPPELQDVVQAVLGFDLRPAASTNHHVLNHAGQVSYMPSQVAQAYNFPANKGANQTIALIELGGGYNDSDLQAYWKKAGIAPVSVTPLGVDGSDNNPSGDPNSADGEVALDIEVAGAIAPLARIAVYFAANTDQGFLDAIVAAIHDPVRKPSVISISWGGPENDWTPQAMNAFNAAFHDAALLGISVCVAAGDGGSDDGVGDGVNHVDFPASSPWVLACGGTRLQAHGSKIISETVWNDGVNGGATGGGVSRHFSMPAYQANSNVPLPPPGGNTTGRGVPDVAGNADPASGYLIIVDGQTGVIGGTSAVAPLWAGLIALFNEKLGKNVGWLHPHLYGAAVQQKAFHDVTSGNNGAFSAGPGWDACTGLGSPNGQAILYVLS
jgi:kumamolisin